MPSRVHERTGGGITADIAPLDLAINGRFLSQRATGVQRVAREFTRALDRLLGEGLYPHLHVRLVAQADPDTDAAVRALELAHIVVERAGGAGGHLWEQAVLPFHVGDAALLCLGNTAPLLSLMGRGRVGVMLHDQAYRLFPGDYSRGYRMLHGVIGVALLRRAAVLFLVSETERRTIAARCRPARSRMTVTPNGSWIDDAPAPARSASERDGPRYGLYVGSFTGRKNIEAVLAVAIALARDRGEHFRFVGPENAAARDLQARIPAALSSHIRFLGYVPNEALPALYGGAAYLLYPSFYEASGLPPSEAMAFGCPVVVSDLPVLHERCGDAAIYCDPHDTGSIERAILQILDDPNAAATLAAKGRARAELFTWRGQARAIVERLCNPAT